MAKVQPSPRNYLAKDFNDLRNDLLRYAKIFFPDRIQDFNDVSLGALLVDMPAAVGDTLTYYLDHQFNELSWSDAVELSNVERHLRNAGVKIMGASPALVDLTFFIEVPAVLLAGQYVPQEAALPVIIQNTIVKSTSGVFFSTTSDLDFGARDAYGFLLASVEVEDTDTSGVPTSFVLSRNVSAVSGLVTTEKFTVPAGHNPFHTITIANINVSSIISVTDVDGNEYYETESLAQDTVFRRVSNVAYDVLNVSDNVEVIAAPRRFITSTNLSTRKVTLTFGGGDASLIDEDTFPDPSRLALPLYGGSAIPRFSVDPNSLLRSRTLGVAPSNTTLSVKYRHGGGLNHNVDADSLRTITNLVMEFRRAPTSSVSADVRASTDVTNREKARGAAMSPTVDELRSQIPAARNSQLRIVTNADLISRIYSLPLTFGKVVRAGVRKNPNNPLAKQLFVLSLDASGKLTQCTDTLKTNLVTYLNEHRLISDAVDILDAPIVNFVVEARVIVSSDFVSTEVLKSVISTLQRIFNIANFQIDRPIILSEAIAAVINIPGIVSLSEITLKNVNGSSSGRDYSSTAFDMQSNTVRGAIIGPPGSVFELRYPEADITAMAV